MKKRLSSIISFMLLLMGMAGTSLACSSSNPTCPSPSVSQTWTQTHSWQDANHTRGVLLNSANPTATWDFALADFVPAFDATYDKVYSFTLSIDFQDDSDSANERADIDLGSFSFTSTSSSKEEKEHDASYTISDFDYTFIKSGDIAKIMADFSADNLLRLTIASLSISSGTSRCGSGGSTAIGDFYLKSATLTAKGCDFPTPPPPPPTPAPEPASMLLLGTGLVSLAGSRLGKRKSSSL